MPCNSWDPVTCAERSFGNAVASAVPSAWSAICKSFAQAAADVLTTFAHAFTSIPSVAPGAAGIHSVYIVSLGLAAFVAVLLVFGQIIRTAWTADGSGLAQALTGGGKTVVAWMATATVATAALQASNNLTNWIVAQTTKTQGPLAVRLAGIVNWAQVTGPGGQGTIAVSLLLFVALVGIVLVIVLWFELLLRNAAIAILIAMSPIAAAGQMSETTKVWWQRTCSAALQLIIMKPVIALVFAVGFAMSGNSHGVEAVLEGLLVLVLAVFSWPVIARFFTFASIQASSSGLATALGFALGRASSGGGRGGGPAGQDPQRWSLGTEQRTMASRGGGADGAAGPEGGLAGGGMGGGPGGTPGGGPGTGGGGASGGGGFGAVAAGVGMALQAAYNAGSALAGRMEQTAGHAGMHGAYPYSTVGGSGGRRMRRQGYGSGQGGAPMAPGGTDGNQGPQAAGTPDEPAAPKNEQAEPRNQGQNAHPLPAEPNAASPDVPPNVPADSSTPPGDVPESGGQPGGLGQRPAGPAPDSPPGTDRPFSPDAAPVTDSMPPQSSMAPESSGPNENEPGPAPDIREEYGSDFGSDANGDDRS